MPMKTKTNVSEIFLIIKVRGSTNNGIENIYKCAVIMQEYII